MLLLGNNRERKAYWQSLTERYTAAQVEEALQSLPAATARVVRLHHRQGRSLKDIAALTGRSVSTVRNHYTLGMYRMTQYFGEGKFR